MSDDYGYREEDDLQELTAEDLELDFHEIQAMAEELTSLDPVTDKARVHTISWRIIGSFLNMVDSDDRGRAYFPLMRVSHRRIVTHEAFDIILLDELTRLTLMQKYDPEKASFYTALKNRITWRISTHLKGLGKIGIIESLEDHPEVCDTVQVHPEGTGVKADFESDIPGKLRAFAILIADNMYKEKHYPGKKMRYERFFTYYLSQDVKQYDGVAREAISENDAIFPVMEIILLKYIMDGCFHHMRDVVSNELKNSGVFKNYKRTMEGCYGDSGPTSVDRHKAYQRLKKSVGM